MKYTFMLLGLILSVSSSFAGTETFKLYTEANAEVSNFCDRYTKLEMTVDGEFAHADLSNHVKGGCEIFVPLNPRSVDLVGQDDGCGSIVYSQTITAFPAIEIVDNRRRTCENMIPALIVVNFIDKNGNRFPLFSKDN